MTVVKDVYYAGVEFMVVVGMIDSIMPEEAKEGWEEFLNDAITILEKKRQEAIEFGSAYDPD